MAANKAFSLLLKAGEAAPAVVPRPPLWSGPAPVPVLIDPHDRTALGKAVGQHLDSYLRGLHGGYLSSQLHEAAEALLCYLLAAFPQYNCVVVRQEAPYVARLRNKVAFDVVFPTIDRMAAQPFDAIVFEEGNFLFLAPCLQKAFAFGGNWEGTCDGQLLFKSRRT